MYRTYAACTSCQVLGWLRSSKMKLYALCSLHSPNAGRLRTGRRTASNPRLERTRAQENVLGRMCLTLCLAGRRVEAVEAHEDLDHARVELVPALLRDDRDGPD